MVADRDQRRAEKIPRPTNWTPGPIRTWNLPDQGSVEASLDRLPPVVADADAGTMRGSAVLVLLAAPSGVTRGGDVEVLLTKRSDHLRNHAGQVSFPGGRIDPAERPVDAALREAAEEVSLDAAGVHVYGQLPPHSTKVSNSFIVPVVARGQRDTTLVPNPAEVDVVFWLPLSALAALGAHHSEIWQVDGDDHEVHFFDVPDIDGDGRPELVWGATAHMLVTLLDHIASEGSVGSGE